MQQVPFTLFQLAAIGFAGSFLVIIFRLLLEAAMKAKLVVPDIVMIVMVYIASWIMAYLFFPTALPSLPVFSPTDITSWAPNLFAWLGSLIVTLSAYAATASAIYIIMLKKVKDGLGAVIAPKVYVKNPAPTTKPA